MFFEVIICVFSSSCEARPGLSVVDIAFLGLPPEWCPPGPPPVDRFRQHYQINGALCCTEQVLFKGALGHTRAPAGGLDHIVWGPPHMQLRMSWRDRKRGREIIPDRQPCRFQGRWLHGQRVARLPVNLGGCLIIWRWSSVNCVELKKMSSLKLRSSDPSTVPRHFG